MIDETDIQQILKKDGFELSDDDFKLLLEIVKSQINQGLDVPIEPVSFTQVENGFNDDKLLVDMFPIDEIHSLKIGDSILVIDTINTKTNDFGIIDIPLNYDEGKYTLKLTYNGTDKIIGSYYFNKVDQEIKNIIIKSNAKTTLTLEKDSIYFGGELKYILKDKKGNGIADANITININGKDYIRTTDSNGNAFMKLKLQHKTYTITAKYAGDKVNPNASTINQVKVNSIILTQDVVKYFKNGTQFNAKLVDSDGNPVANKIINFNINGVFYHKETNKEGIATLNINLRPNTYIITSEYDNCFVSNNVTVKTTLVTNDLTKVYLGPESFNATVLDGQGKALANQNVTFNINGVFYTKTTNSNGIASLSIRLMAGEYIITSIYDGYATSNKVTVKA